MCWYVLIVDEKTVIEEKKVEAYQNIHTGIEFQETQRRRDNIEK